MSKNKISSSKHRKGSFASQAKRAGMSLPKFANYVIRNYRDETSSYNPTIKTYRRAIYYKDTIPNRKSKRGKTKRRKMKARMDIPRTSSGPIELSLVEKERTREGKRGAQRGGDHAADAQEGANDLAWRSLRCPDGCPGGA